MRFLFQFLFVILRASEPFAQGTFIYDQQSAVEGARGEGSAVIQAYQPMGALFADYVGSLLITEAGEFTVSNLNQGSLYIVNYDTSINNFVIRSITFPGKSFEHVTFAPIHLPILP
jgi:hypothetical protein